MIGNYCTVTGSAVIGERAHLGEGVYMGFHASVAADVRVGDGALIGAGSTAVKEVAPHTTVVGVPAKPVGPKLTDLPAFTMDQMIAPPEYMI